MNRLLDIDLNDPLAVRDRAMLEVMYGAGLRLSELVNLDLKHLDLESRREGGSWVRAAKSAACRWVATPSPWIEHWLDLGGLFGAEEDALFLSKLGKRISARNVQKRFAEWGIKTGAEQPCSPAQTAPLVYTICLNRAAICAACRSFGHANLSTTQIYTHLDFQHLASVYDAAHPRAKRGNQCVFT